MIKFSCSCGKSLKVAAESAGKKIKCPGCGKAAVAPAAVVAGGIDLSATVSSPDVQPPLGDLPTDPATSALNPTVAPAASTPREETHTINRAAMPKVDAAGDLLSLGGYRILRQLGEGGMGTVYEAEDIKLERRVALKVMKPEIAADQQNRERFLREACTAASVESDFICPIFEVGEENGVPFIAMQFLKGKPLNAHWKKEMRLSLDEVVRIGKEVAEGLSAAHEAGLVHRDIKPANIWLETQPAGPPRAVILDFGLARKQVEDVHLTQTGAVLGTPAYMSPEQARADAHVDARTDLFSLGSVLYALCTGELPFKGETTMAILTALATKTPTPPAKIAPTPKPLSGLIMRLLAKNPDDRPQTAREVIEKLVEIEKDCANRATESMTERIKPAKHSDTEVLRVPRSADKTQRVPVTVPGAPPRKTAYALFTLVALGLLGCVVLLAGGGVYYIVTDKGTIEIRTEDAKVQVLLLKNGQEIEILDGVSKKTWAIRTGTYTVRLKDDPDGLEIVMPDKFEMKRGDKHVVTIRKTGPKGAPARHFALQFDGESSYVEIPTLRRADLGPVTIEAWVNAEPPTSATAIMMHGGKASCCMSASDLNWTRTPGSGATFFATDRTLDRPFLEKALKQGLVHLAYVADAKEGRLYLDGDLVDRGPRTKGPEGTYDTHTWLGAHPEGETLHYHFHGLISQVRVSKTARYDKSFTPAKRFVPDNDTRALYLFDEGQGDKLTDSSGNNHHGKIVGARWVNVETIAPKAPLPAATPFDAAQAKKHQEAWAKHLGVPVEYTNSLGMKFRLVPPGTFTMGSSKEETGRCVKLNEGLNKGDDATWNRDRINSEGPAHEVEITQPFYLGTTHVTIGQYRQFVEDLKYQGDGRRWEKPGWEQTDAHPVVSVAWNDAIEFCKWLSKKEGQDYRLPTEAEWEHSCRAGTTTRYWFGDNEDDLARHAWFKTNSLGKAHPVKQFPANPFGLYDMHGNAWQWCQDLHDPNFYKISPRKDPRGAGDGRLLRGGAWDCFAFGCRSTVRNCSSLDANKQREANLGFRAALSVDAVKQR